EKLMGNFVGEFETSVLPTMTMFEGNRYPLIRTTLKPLMQTLSSFKNQLGVLLGVQIIYLF
ncbi:MAG: hypothetical protein DRG78_10245, partial [Epsilonproteobacteria bacterium]